MASSYKRLKREARGQAMVETALMLPLLLGLVFNTVNFGYFFLVAVNLAAAPRSGALYSILGASTPINVDLACPVPGAVSCPSSPVEATVSFLTLGDLTGAIANGGSAGVQVCTAQAGTNGSGASLLTVCNWVNGSPSYAPAPDPEAPAFVLNRVDVTYAFTPPLDQRLFNLVLLATPTCTGTGGSVKCTFHRQVSMRAMN